MNASHPHYALGHDDSELERLTNQSRFLGDITEHQLGLAGLRPGMRVLDVGCGAGDVSFLAARLTGPDGHITGVDRAAEAVERARARAEDATLTNIRFVAGEAEHLELDAPVDAVVGRLVLMYNPDAAGLLRRLRRLLVPGGLMTFQEFDMTRTASEPTCALFEQTMDRVRETFRRVGAGVRTGLQLHQIFVTAGLPAPQMIEGARVEAGPESPAYEQVAGIVRTLLPALERTGVATAAEVDINTLAQRLRAEAVALNAVIVTPPLIAAWSRNTVE